MDIITIHIAAGLGKLQYLRHLIESGVSVDSRDDEGRTPLHIAARQNQYKVAEFLISNKCDFNLVDNADQTPLLYAAVFDHKEVMHLLLDHGAEVTNADFRKWTVLHYAVYHGWVDIVQRIVKSGEADLNAVNDTGSTPLILAVIGKFTEIASLLIQAGADVNAGDYMKLTVLHWAAYEGQVAMLRLLLENEKLELDPQDQKGCTPLHRACCSTEISNDVMRTEVVRQLLVAGADHKIKNNDGLTALQDVIRRANSSRQVIRLFIERGAFFEDTDYERMSNNPFLRNSVLNDVDLCTKSIVNKYHSHSLHSLYCNPYFAKRLPPLENFKLNARQIDEVEDSVRTDIRTNSFCNLVKICSMALSVFCVKSLVSCPIYE